ncbi:MAG: non-canonical purine NTP pyrophosphatase [Planctomycetota bacterium]|nr:MAG: non-canonical purine NTP pyrophosphatase [Planctomycetota bacterium]REK44317.1 MAG: non-canonical purine NTP pyrophosphatase [Planctomycetota bacterium]
MPFVSPLILGTHNRKKGEELAEQLAPLGIEVQTLATLPEAIEVVEDGDSFAENSSKKAVQQARHLGRWVIGEDSGICVDALDGAPGIYSARFSGPQASDEANNLLLLEKLAGKPPAARGAHYVCYMTLADPDGNLRAESEGICRGRIREEPVGSAGFGYDPLFEVIEYHRTFGQLGATVKGVLSHRARAVALMIPQIRRLLHEIAA